MRELIKSIIPEYLLEKRRNHYKRKRKIYERSEISNQLLDILISPLSGAKLHVKGDKLVTSDSKEAFTIENKNYIDLRLTNSKEYKLTFTVNKEPIPELNFQILTKKVQPEVDFSGLDVPIHLSEEILSYFPKGNSSQLMLDLGCGNLDMKEVCEKSGFEYVGIDIFNSRATINADAHALPFSDNSFEFILSANVLEHVENPFIVVNEIFRVLKPDGIFIGTVAFLEPLHGDSHFHHSHLGIGYLLNSIGFEVSSISPNIKWSVADSMPAMGFMKNYALLGRLFFAPLKYIHKLIWFNDKINRLKTFGGSFAFIAHKRI